MSVARSSLRANLAWVLGGNLVYTGCQWGMLVALARLGSPQLVGDFALALAVTGPIFVFATLNLRAAQATDQRGEFAFADYVHLRVACVLAAALVVAAILAGGGFDRATVAVIALVGATKAFDALSDVVYGLLQQHERMRRIALSRILQGSLQLAALAATLAATRSLVLATAATAAVSLAVTLLYDVPSARGILRHVAGTGGARRSLGDVAPRAVGRLLVVALPLGVAAALDALNANVPRYLLDAHGGRAELGVYAALAYFLTGQGMVLTAVADAARPRLARAFLESGEDFARLFRQLACIAVAAALLALLVAAAAGAAVLAAVYGDAYAVHAGAFTWIMAAAVPWNLAGVVGTALAATRRFRALALSFVAMTLATSLASLALVPAYGVVGAAWALGLGMVVRLGVGSIVLWRAVVGAGAVVGRDVAPGAIVVGNPARPVGMRGVATERRAG